MKRALGVIATLALIVWAAGLLEGPAMVRVPEAEQSSPPGGKMELGRFSVSLAVKDLKKSREFYEKLGFRRVDGSKEGDRMEPGQDWIILQHGEAKIGLFQGMFEKNILTFNPKNLRGIAADLKKVGVDLELKNMYGPLTGTSPAYAVLADPDGNQILLDQLPEK